nr:hypothetical protein [Tanacetum cinerariifolium]
MDAVKEHNVVLEKERNALDVKVTDLEASAKGKERGLIDLNSLLTFVKSQNDILVDQVHKLKVSSFGLQEKMALHLEEKFYPYLLTTISERRWLLTQGVELAVVMCLNSPEYLSVLGVAISKAIKKGMQDGLSAGITHGREWRVLTDVAAYNPSAKADYTSALQMLQSVNFSLLANLRSNKDASMVPIYHSPDRVVIGATALSLALDVSSMEGAFSIAMSVAANTTTALSTTLASASTILPITIEDYEVMGAKEAQGNGQCEVASFPHLVELQLRNAILLAEPDLVMPFYLYYRMPRPLSGMLAGHPPSAGLAISLAHMD